MTVASYKELLKQRDTKNHSQLSSKLEHVLVKAHNLRFQSGITHELPRADFDSRVDQSTAVRRQGFCVYNVYVLLFDIFYIGPGSS